jgi:FkbM family methyltransferase
MPLKLFVKRLLGREPRVRVTTRVAVRRFGGEYGGWQVAADHLSARPLVYSCGVGEDISFDREMISAAQARVFAFDPTPRVVKFIQGVADELGNDFTFVPVAIGARDGRLTLFPPADSAWVSHRSVPDPATANRGIDVPMRSVSSVMREFGHTRLDILKLDIEGAEYDAIADILDSDIRVGQLLIEFHHRFPGIGIERTRSSIEQLETVGFLPFAVGATGQEVSFIHASVL